MVHAQCQPSNSPPSQRFLTGFSVSRGCLATFRTVSCAHTKHNSHPKRLRIPPAMLSSDCTTLHPNHFHDPITT
ncbi:hypothetical protein VTK26DRAFT_8258 [Humicola hyalothermophila]